jgi:hypothetical protein
VQVQQQVQVQVQQPIRGFFTAFRMTASVGVGGLGAGWVLVGAGWVVGVGIL